MVSKFRRLDEAQSVTESEHGAGAVKRTYSTYRRLGVVDSWADRVGGSVQIVQFRAVGVR